MSFAVFTNAFEISHTFRLFYVRYYVYREHYIGCAVRKKKKKGKGEREVNGLMAVNARLIGDFL